MEPTPEQRQKAGEIVCEWDRDNGICLLADHRDDLERCIAAALVEAGGVQNCKRCNGSGEVEGYGGNNVMCGHCAGGGKDLMSLFAGPQGDKEAGEGQGEREFFCHWLLRAYEAGHRDTSYEEGETLASVLREINQVLGFAGYEPESKERGELLQREFGWQLPNGRE